MPKTETGTTKIPNLKAEFEKAASPAPEPETKQAQGVVTREEYQRRAELDKTLANRLMRPAPQLNLDMDGAAKKELDAAAFEERKTAFEENRKRLEYLESRLNRVNLTREFNRVR